jgi:motility quorum-sensing regulator/GCU-specific mRNA interferase toxin
MEKRTPHRKLSLVKDLVKANKVRATVSAFNGASELGIYTLSGMCDVILLLTMANFDKSMTTHVDHRIWQDVYKVLNTSGSDIYLKLTVVDDVLIVSFKEL